VSAYRFGPAHAVVWLEADSHERLLQRIERLRIGMQSVGVVLAVASFVQLAGGAVGGIVAGRIGLKRTMVLALTMSRVSR
jgi:MFS family permease